MTCINCFHGWHAACVKSLCICGECWGSLYEPCRTHHPEWEKEDDFPGWPCLIEDDLCLNCGLTPELERERYGTTQANSA